MENNLTGSGATVAAGFRFSFMTQYEKFIDRGAKTRLAYLNGLKQFAAWLRFSEILNPQRENVIDFRDYLGTEHEQIQLDTTTPKGWRFRLDRNGHRQMVTCKPATIKSYLQAIRLFFKWTAAEGLYPNIAENIHTPKIRQDFHKKSALTAPDVLAIEKSIEAGADRKQQAASENPKDTAGRTERATEQGKRLRAVYLLAVTCGLRTIEISRANVRDLETIGGVTYLYVWGKGHSEADARKPLAAEVREALEDYLATRATKPTPESPLFVSTGNRSGGKRIAANTIGVMLKQAMKEAGYNSARLTAHSLRHTAGTSVQELCGDLFLTQKYMRHESPKTTEIYLHNRTEEREAEVAQRLYDFYHSAGEDPKEETLEGVAEELTTDQRAQLLTLARAMKQARA